MSRCDLIIAYWDINKSIKQTNQYLCYITMVKDTFYLLNQLVKNVLRPPINANLRLPLKSHTQEWVEKELTNQKMYSSINAKKLNPMKYMSGYFLVNETFNRRHEIDRILKAAYYAVRVSKTLEWHEAILRKGQHVYNCFLWYDAHVILDNPRQSAIKWLHWIKAVAMITYKQVKRMMGHIRCLFEMRKPNMGCTCIALIRIFGIRTLSGLAEWPLYHAHDLVKILEN